MRNDDGNNLSGERIIVTPGEGMPEFLPEPGAHEARNLANAALNTEGFSPDEIVSFSNNTEEQNLPPIMSENLSENIQDNAIKDDASSVVKIITTDRKIDTNKELKVAMGVSEKIMSGRMSPYDFARKMRGSLDDATTGEAA